MVNGVEHCMANRIECMTMGFKESEKPELEIQHKWLKDNLEAFYKLFAPKVKVLPK
jgi:hypothetical protein